jgi:hypothetical protein
MPCQLSRGLFGSLATQSRPSPLHRERLPVRKAFHAITTAYALLAQAMLGSIVGDPERAIVFADRALAICDEHGIADWGPWAHFAKGDLLARRGEPQLGISVMRNALAELERAGAKQQRTMRLGCLAAAHMSLRQFDVGLGLLDEAIQTAEQTQERVYEAELHSAAICSWRRGKTAKRRLNWSRH